MSLISLAFMQYYQQKLSQAIKSYVASHSAVNLSNQKDVAISNPSSGQVLTYNSSVQKWVNANGGGGGGSAQELDDLSDVVITGVQDGQVLTWDNGEQRWVNGDGGGTSIESLDDIQDVNITNPTNGQALIYDDALNKWKNGTISGGTTNYADLTNKPSINGTTLSGNKTSSDLNLMPKPTYLTQTLTAGSTSVTFTDSSISNGSYISVYTNVAGLNYTSLTSSAGTITITYPAQSSNVTVVLEVKNV